ncbi:NAD-dependent epimerase/dehydratase [Desulfarculus baarsii DSM 2075]|uniref:NAD-dependent epimerase/dehydratase n=1 Tax=Desulfarculus baarsii (strain ATCC 33931 / DSM 2075 / LMG 7858 / VKM B-1802 / 2st14) TaxID=644282 RepID=E1QEK3_DESB2|nr:NAD(P)-dependent oxidoreductase [Desulfarculus baarsii]ADK83989.1 NAD-dependent epimerase/dehydratase [Desulfarculus baarsii DSM 2075]
MKILVTGGTGFTGAALVERLLGLGHQVVALDNKEGLKPQALRDMGAEVVIGSVTDEPLVRRCMRGVEVVHHLAAAFREMDVPRNYYDQVNEGGARLVAQAAQDEGVRKFIYCSTCGVHGNVERPPADENAPINAADYYQQTKYNGEVALRPFIDAGMKATILRPAAIYGPGDPERFWMIYSRVQKGVFPMFGSGKTLYHPLYIDNLIDAFLLAQEEDKGLGQAYLIADEQYYPIEELVTRVAKAMGKPVRIPHFPVWPVVAAGHVCEKLCKPFGVAPPIFPRRVDWYRQNRAFDIGKAKRELGYQPKVGIDEGLRKTYEWYVREGYL